MDMSEHLKEKTFVLGGSIEKAIAGNVELNPVNIIREALQNTIKHFVAFSPAILLLSFSYMAVFFVILKFQIGSLDVLFNAILGKTKITAELSYAIFAAGLITQVAVSPLIAGASLIGMSHAAGFKCNVNYIFKGLSSAGMVALVTILSEVLQGLANIYLPIFALYLSMAFGFSVLLVCEKKLSPFKALLYSFRATNKKIASMLLIHLVMMLALVIGIAMYGIGLVVVIPFIFNVKGIIYRNMFGVTLKIIAKDDKDHDSSLNQEMNSGVFNA